MPPAAWSDDDLAALRRLWSEGKTALAISKEIGKSRSSVLAKARRLNLPGRRDGKGSGLREAARLAAKTAKPPQYRPTRERQDIAGQAFGEKTAMIDLKSGQCRWPVGDPRNEDFGFCAAATCGHVYCDQHRRVAYS